MNSKLKFILSMFISLFLIFGIIVTYIGYLGKYLLSSSDFCISQIENTNIAQTVYDNLELTFDSQYSTTAIPAEVYMDCIDVEWIENTMKEHVYSSYSLLQGTAEQVAYSPDYTELEASITQYFEEYAQQNNYQKDEVYNQKLTQSIENAKTIINNSTDIYKLEVMKKANIWSKAGKLKNIIEKIVPVCTISVIVLIVILILFKNPVYWIGTSLFASGAILTVPTVWVLASSVIRSFSIKEVAIYTVVTGAMTQLTEIVMISGIIMLVIGIIMIISGIIMNRK